MALQAGFVGPTQEELNQQNYNRMASLAMNIGQGIREERMARLQLEEQQRQYNIATGLREVLKGQNPYLLAQTDAGQAALRPYVGQLLGTNNPRAIQEYLDYLASSPQDAATMAAAAQSAVAGGRVGSEAMLTPGPAPTGSSPMDFMNTYAVPPVTAEQGSTGRAPSSVPAETPVPSAGPVPNPARAIQIQNALLIPPNTAQNKTSQPQIAATYAEIQAMMQSSDPDVKAAGETLMGRYGAGSAGISSLAGTPEYTKRLATLTSPASGIPTTVGGRTVVTQETTIPTGQAMIRTQDVATPQGASAGAQGEARSYSTFRKFLAEGINRKAFPGAPINPDRGSMTDEQLMANNQEAAKAYQAYQQSGTVPWSAAPVTIASSGSTVPNIRSAPLADKITWAQMSETPEGQAQLAARGIQVASRKEILEIRGIVQREAEASGRQAVRWAASTSQSERDRMKAEASARMLNITGPGLGIEVHPALSGMTIDFANLDRRLKEAQIQEIMTRTGLSYLNAETEYQKAIASQLQAQADVAEQNNEQLKIAVDNARTLIQASGDFFAQISKNPDPKAQAAMVTKLINDNAVVKSAYQSWLAVQERIYGAKALDTSMSETAKLGFLGTLLKRATAGGEQVPTTTFSPYSGRMGATGGATTQEQQQAGLSYTYQGPQ